MKLSDSIIESTGEAYGYARAYIEQQIEFAKLDIAERLSIAISSAVTTMVVLLLIFMVMGFLSIAGGFYLAERLGSFGEAFLVISGIYAAITLIVILMRRVLITNPVLSKIIKIFFEIQ